MAVKHTWTEPGMQISVAHVGQFQEISPPITPLVPKALCAAISSGVVPDRRRTGYSSLGLVPGANPAPFHVRECPMHSGFSSGTPLGHGSFSPGTAAPQGLPAHVISVSPYPAGSRSVMVPLTPLSRMSEMAQPHARPHGPPRVTRSPARPQKISRQPCFPVQKLGGPESLRARPPSPHLMRRQHLQQPHRVMLGRSVDSLVLPGTEDGIQRTISPTKPQVVQQSISRSVLSEVSKSPRMSPTMSPNMSQHLRSSSSAPVPQDSTWVPPLHTVDFTRLAFPKATMTANATMTSNATTVRAVPILLKDRGDSEALRTRHGENVISVKTIENTRPQVLSQFECRNEHSASLPHGAARFLVDHKLAQQSAETGQLEWPTLGEEMIIPPPLDLTLSQPISKQDVNRARSMPADEETICPVAPREGEDAEQSWFVVKLGSGSLSRELTWADKTCSPVRAVPVLRRDAEVQTVDAQVAEPDQHKAFPATIWSAGDAPCPAVVREPAAYASLLPQPPLPPHCGTGSGVAHNESCRSLELSCGADHGESNSLTQRGENALDVCSAWCTPWRPHGACQDGLTVSDSAGNPQDGGTTNQAQSLTHSKQDADNIHVDEQQHCTLDTLSATHQDVSEHLSDEEIAFNTTELDGNMNRHDDCNMSGDIVSCAGAATAWTTFVKEAQVAEPDIDDQAERFQCVERASTASKEEEDDAEPLCLRVHIGRLNFKGLAHGAGGGIFEQVSFRVSVSLPSSTPKWIDGEHSTPPKTAAFHRVVPQNGRYYTVLACDFDDYINFPWTGKNKLEPFPCESVAADVWLEKVTLFDKVEKLLGVLGIGDGPKLDHLWLGRAVATVPPWATDAPFQNTLVDATHEANYPEPSSIDIGIEWVEDAHEL